MDRWRRYKRTLETGHTLQLGTRRTMVNVLREELEAGNVPEAWHTARVLDPDGNQVGFGLSADEDTAQVYALYQAGLLKKLDAAVSERAAVMALTGASWR